MGSVEQDRLERAYHGAMVPARERTEEWVRDFEAAFWPSFFMENDPPVVYGSEDGLAYRALKFQTSEAAPLPGLESYARPASIVDDLIQNGQGLVLMGDEGAALCTFTLGEIVSYRLYGRAFERPSAVPSVNQIPAGATLELSPPHESNFPAWARIGLRRYFKQQFGIEKPKACWCRFPNGNSGLVFDFEARRFPDNSVFDPLFRRLRWYLPARLQYFRVDELAGANEMQAF